MLPKSVNQAKFRLLVYALTLAAIGGTLFPKLAQAGVLDQLSNTIDQTVQQVTNAATDPIRQVEGTIDRTVGSVEQTVDRVVGSVTSPIDNLLGGINHTIQTFLSPFQQQLQQYLLVFNRTFEKILGDVFGGVFGASPATNPGMSSGVVAAGKLRAIVLGYRTGSRMGRLGVRLGENCRTGSSGEHWDCRMCRRITRRCLIRFSAPPLLERLPLRCRRPIASTPTQ